MYIHVIILYESTYIYKTVVQSDHNIKFLAACMQLAIPYMENIWWEKFWRTIQVKAIGEEKFGK